jgi:hypothetical protein
MAKKKSQEIEEQLQLIEQLISNAEDYVARNVNVEGSTWLHLGDWRGKSGHPLWMKNHMIPTLMKRRAKAEKALEAIDDKTKDKELMRRRRRAAW